MGIEISPELEQFVEQEVTHGRFSDRSAVVEYALHLLIRDREEAVAGIQTGLEDVAAGRTQPLKQAFNELRSDSGIAED